MTNVHSGPYTDSELAALGEGHLAYLRRMSSDDIRAKFPSAQSIRPGLNLWALFSACLLYTSPSPRDLSTSRMPSSA